ncbi:hypothetical protein M758_9G004200 [Ceratodon purpureus]|nr:hypothetical protein M758_9G004200 [Ceratodon purpureus]
MPPLHVHTPVGPSPWVGAVVTVAILLLPAAAPHIAKSTRHLLKPRKCPLCLGVGNNLCCHCKGRGKQGGVFTGTPLRRCSVCDGRGRQLCSPCEASGLSNNWLYQLPANRGGCGPRNSPEALVCLLSFI